MVQCLGLHVPKAAGAGLIPDQGTRPPNATTKSSYAPTKYPACYNQDLAQPNT